MRARPADEDLVRAVLAVARLGADRPAADASRSPGCARELLSPDRIERIFRDRQGAMATELRAILRRPRRPTPLTAAVRAEAVAGAVFAALAVWTESPAPHDLRGWGSSPRRRSSRSGRVLSDSDRKRGVVRREPLAIWPADRP